MKTKKITAIFTGRDGSCGYKKGKKYMLTVWQHSELGYNKIAIELAEKPDEGYCEYSNIVTFLNNWDNIKVIK
jgi:hypothetical protein